MIQLEALPHTIGNTEQTCNQYSITNPRSKNNCVMIMIYKSQADKALFGQSGGDEGDFDLFNQ